MEEYIVTLHNREDLDDFYNDMETPGGDLYIPDRAVDLQLRRQISRNTHYMLTPEEVIELKNDPRVLDVEAKAFLDLVEYECGGYSDSGNWERSTSSGVSGAKNWGILRHTIGANAEGGTWGDSSLSGSTGISSATVNITASGKNVDALIVDGSITTNAQGHPELAVNADGTGGSRVQAFNWFSLTNQLGLGANGTYDYNTVGDESDTNHGVHVAGTVAGNTLGWAREANIYNIEFNSGASAVNHGSGGLSSLTLWDYIREWHNTKPINPETGRRNPTVSNHSYYGTYSKDGVITNGPYDGIGAMRYRGVTFDKYGDEGNDLNDAEMEARGVNVPADGNWKISAWSASLISDIDDAIADGIIIVAIPGNHYQKNVKQTNQDYNNFVYLRQGSNQYQDTLAGNRGAPLAASEETLTIGSLDTPRNDRKANYSVCGDLVDIFAAGNKIASGAVTNGFGGATDPRNSSYWIAKIGGTSMACPQVAGVVALLLESNPNMTQTEVNTWIEANATTDLMYDTGTDSSTDHESLQGAPNRMLRWINQRPESGASFPKVNAKARPTSGSVYPRPRIRRRG
jgi:subtilisin family serine protease